MIILASLPIDASLAPHFFESDNPNRLMIEPP
jgi:hypothetical protein